MQRRIEQADRDRQASHDLEQFDEIRALHRQQLRKRRPAALFIVGENHLAHRDDTLAFEEHVLGPTEADAFRPELHGGACIQRRFGIGADLQAAGLVSPEHEIGELTGEFRLEHGDLALKHLPIAAINGDEIPALQRLAAAAHRAVDLIDPDRTGTGDARLAHAARHHGRMARHAAACRENAFGGVHPVNIFRRGFHAHKNDLALFLHGLLRLFRGEDDLAGRSPRRGRQAGGNHVALRLGVNGGVQKLVKRGGIDAHHRLIPADEALIGEVNRDPQCCLRGALAIARLQHPELAAFDGEFHVLHVAIMRFQQFIDAHEFAIALRQRGFEAELCGAGRDARLLRDVLRRPDTSHDILALRIDQELAVEFLFAIGRIAREGDASRRGVAHVAENHGLHVDRRAPTCRDRVEITVFDRARIHP